MLHRFNVKVETILFAALLLSGCVANSVKSTTLPPLMASPSDGDIVEDIYIVSSDGASNSDLDRLLEALRKSGIFHSVSYSIETPPNGTLLLQDFIDHHPKKWDGFQCFEPYLLIGSLGLIPAYCTTHHDVSFKITRVGGKSAVSFAFSYDELSIEGWVALLYRVSSAWSNEPPTEHYSRLLRAAFVERKSELSKIVDSHAP